MKGLEIKMEFALEEMEELDDVLGNRFLHINSKLSRIFDEYTACICQLTRACRMKDFLE
jgi:hypothetical protein